MIKFRIALPLLLTMGLGATFHVHADDLLIKRVHHEQSMNLPKRGMTMKQVEAQYGAPLHKLDPRGGDTPRHPVIHRWEYAGYIVYFERNHVIHSVLNTPAGNNTKPQS